MKLVLVLTHDWEVFGDGTGDFQLLQKKPLEELISVVEQLDCRITVFAELGQQLWGALRFKDNEPQLGRQAEDWEENLIRACQKGLDIQAHLHTQWLNAKRNSGTWLLDMNLLSTGAVPDAQLVEALSRCKSYLEGLLRNAQPHYRCLCYRAGAFYMEPRKKALQALCQAGFKADSSVVPGLIETPFCDYDAFVGRVSPWWLEESICPERGSDRKLLELPLYAERRWDSPLLRKMISPAAAFRVFFGERLSDEDLTWQKLRNAELRRLYPLVRRPLYTKGNLLQGLSQRIIGPNVLVLNYDQFPPTVFSRLVGNALSRIRAGSNQGVALIVALGHSKGFINGANLKRIVQQLRLEFQEELAFWTVRDAIEYYYSTAEETTSADST